MNSLIINIAFLCVHLGLRRVVGPGGRKKNTSNRVLCRVLCRVLVCALTIWIVNEHTHEKDNQVSHSLLLTSGPRGPKAGDFTISLFGESRTESKVQKMAWGKGASDGFLQWQGHGKTLELLIWLYPRSQEVRDLHFPVCLADVWWKRMRLENSQETLKSGVSSLWCSNLLTRDVGNTFLRTQPMLPLHIGSCTS